MLMGLLGMQPPPFFLNVTQKQNKRKETDEKQLKSIFVFTHIYRENEIKKTNIFTLTHFLLLLHCLTPPPTFETFWILAYTTVCALTFNNMYLDSLK